MAPPHHPIQNANTSNPVHFVHKSRRVLQPTQGNNETLNQQQRPQTASNNSDNNAATGRMSFQEQIDAIWADIRWLQTRMADQERRLDRRIADVESSFCHTYGMGPFDEEDEAEKKEVVRECPLWPAKERVWKPYLPR